MKTYHMILIFALSGCLLIAGCSKNNPVPEPEPEAPTLTVAPTEDMEFSAEATESYTIRVTTNQNNWNAVSDQGWCVVTRHDDSFTVTAKENRAAAAPTPAKITVSAGEAAPVTIAATQYGAAPYANFVNFDASKPTEIQAVGGEFTFSVSSNTSWTVTCQNTTTGTWYDATSGDRIGISVTPLSGNGNGTVTVTIDPAASNTDEYFNLFLILKTTTVSGINIKRFGWQYAIGDYFPIPNKAEGAEGVVFYLDRPANGKSQHGKIVSATEYEGDWGRWGVDESLTIADIRNKGAGAAASQNMVKAYYNANDFSDSGEFYMIWIWLYQMNGSKFDGKWYLPAFYELEALCSGFNGMNLNSDLSTWDYGTMTGFDTASARAARVAFNAKLTALSGGDPLAMAETATVTYYAATEFDQNTACGLYFPNGQVGARSKSVGAKVRAIKQF